MNFTYLAMTATSTVIVLQCGTNTRVTHATSTAEQVVTLLLFTTQNHNAYGCASTKTEKEISIDLSHKEQLSACTARRYEDSDTTSLLSAKGGVDALSDSASG